MEIRTSQTRYFTDKGEVGEGNAHFLAASLFVSLSIH